KPDEFEMVREALAQKELTITSSELGMVPKTTVMLDEKAASQMLKLLEKLEELDEVQQVTTNADFPDAVLVE
ncbi:YebC/PmpR family DNA-binding transcriptional regulator, partial [Chloroflexota bacterium]